MNHLPQVIGFSGENRSGKDTSADRLVDHHGYVKFSFATKLKEMIFRINPLLDSGVYLDEAWVKSGRNEDVLKQSYPEYRRFMTRFATEGMRHADPEFWINQLRNEVNLALQQGKSVVFSDVRFDNEAEYILSLSENAAIYRVIKHDNTMGHYDHSSNRGISDHMVKAEIINDGSIKSLHQKIDLLA